MSTREKLFATYQITSTYMYRCIYVCKYFWEAWLKDKNFVSSINFLLTRIKKKTKWRCLRRILSKYKGNLSGYKREMDLAVSIIEDIIPIGHRGKKTRTKRKKRWGETRFSSVSVDVSPYATFHSASSVCLAIRSGFVFGLSRHTHPPTQFNRDTRRHGSGSLVSSFRGHLVTTSTARVRATCRP